MILAAWKARTRGMDLCSTPAAPLQYPCSYPVLIPLSEIGISVSSVASPSLKHPEAIIFSHFTPNPGIRHCQGVRLHIRDQVWIYSGLLTSSFRFFSLVAITGQNN